MTLLYIALLVVSKFIEKLLSKYSSWWRRLEDVFCLHVQTTCSRHTDQNEYIHLTHTSLEDVLIKTDIFVLVFWRHLEDILKIFSRNSCHLLGGLGDVFKTTSKRPKKMSSRLLLLTCLQDVFETYSTRFRQLSTNRFA